MSQILIVVSSFNIIWLLVALLLLAGVALECERRWTRTRRQRGAAPGAAAYALDGVVIVSMVACAGLIVTLLFQALMALFALVGNLFGWASANPALLAVLVIGVAVIAGVVFVLRRGGTGGSRGAGEALPAASASAPQPAGMISAPPPTPRMANHNLADHASTMSSASAAASRVERPVEQRPAYVPLAAESLASEPAPAFAMLQQRRQYVAAPQPASFLDLAEAQPPESALPKRRRSFMPALATLVVVGVLAGGAALFQQQIGGFFSGRRTAAVVAATSVSSTPASASANVAAAIASPVAVESPAAIGRVKSDSLNVRVSPGIDQAIVVVLAKGDAVTLLNETREIQGEDWVKVRVGSREGWVNQRLLE